MEVLPLVPQYCFKGARLEVEKEAIEAEPVFPTTDTIPPGICQRPSGQKGYQTGKISQLPGSSVYCAQERFLEKESNPGLVTTQQIYPMRQVPNVDYCADTDPATPGGLRNLHRSYRRLLECPNSAPLLPLPWLCSRPQGLCIQDYGLRAKYSSKNIYQADRRSPPRTQEERSASGGLPRRLADLGSVSSRVSTGWSQSNFFPSIVGLRNQLQEVSTSPDTVIHMARSSLGSVSSQVISSGRQEKGDCIGGQDSFKKESDLEETSREGFRLSAICLDNRPATESQTQRYGQSLEESGYETTQRRIFKNTSTATKTDQAVDEGQKTCPINSINASASHSDDSHGCLSFGMGRPLTIQGSARGVVGQVQKFPHKHPRSIGSLSGPQKDSSKRGHNDTSHVRQQHHSSVHKSLRVKISSDQSCNYSHPLSGQEEVLAPSSSSFRRHKERSSRCSVTSGSSGVRMVFGHGDVQVYSEPRTVVADRPICNVGQSSTSTVCSPERRPSSSGNRRNVLGLEPVGEHLSLPASKTFIESSSQTPNFQGSGGLGCSSVAEEQLVSTNNRTQAQDDSSLPADAVPNSTGEACLRFILDDGKASFDDFLVLAMGRDLNLSEDNIRFSEKYKAFTTHRQYDSWWKKWVLFVRSKQPAKITLDFCISFLRHLHEGGLASSTLNSLKSAISVPIKHGFGINLSDDIFQKVVKACAKSRPKLPKQPPSWSLAKVLEKAASIGLDCTDLTLQLRKTAFLITLASSGRISEVTALMRGGEHIQFLQTGEARLTPDRAFLAKNESPSDRWEPWVITPLPQFPALCPVRALKQYLLLTNSIKEGQLFRGETVGSRLSPKQLGNKIIAFICSAEPDKKAKVHELRGIGASLNFYEYMNFEDLKNYTGWKSPRVFYKHYLHSIDSLPVPVVAAGKVIHPR